ncbi:MAG: M3 family metallopeptidase [Rubrivivax sp.]
MPIPLQALAATDAPAQAPGPPIRLLDAAAIEQRCDGEIAKVRAHVARMAKVTGGKGVLVDFNRLERFNGEFVNPVYLFSAVAVDKATRDAAQRCVEKFTPLSSEVFQNSALYQRVKAFEPADDIDRVYRKDLLDRFDEAGASLPPAKRARAKVIADRIEIVGLAFQKAINEDPTTVVLPPDDAEGLPADWLAARQRDEAGHLVLKMDYPTVVPFLQNATREGARQKVWTAFQNQGGADNLTRLDEVLALRYELAQLHGKPDYASFALRQRMAATPAAVQSFLSRVRDAVLTLEQGDLADLRAEKATLTGQPLADVRVQRWDASYLQERIKRERYSIDQEKLRAYFPTDASVAFAMRVAERLYGIRFDPVKLPVWHPDVRTFAVHDRPDAVSGGQGGTASKGGAFLGTVYLDLVPREGKFNHAAAFGIVSGSTLAGRRPASVLVTNFNAKGLDHDELQTLLHEFGHVLHGVLSTTRYADQSGTSVKRDFVEAPSQMFEEWARRPQTLALFAEVCPDCPRLSAEQLKQLEAARTYGRGLRYSRQWEYASYDMRLHTGQPKPALQTWIELEQTMPLGYVDGTILPAGFGHLMGYAAGYYGYLWSEVMALDMLSAFHGDLMSPETGRRYRRLILSRGGEVPPQQMVERFLGRKSSPDAFFAEITGTR